jgi:SNF2 family DNA or RNA helicase
MIREFQQGTGPGALVLSIRAGGTGLSPRPTTWSATTGWNPVVEDQARDRASRIGQTNTVVSHRLVCPGTVDEQVEEVVAGKRWIADLVLPTRSSVGDLTPDQLRQFLGLRREALVDETSADTHAHHQADEDHKAHKETAA